MPAEDAPELIFFDTDELPEEADFIRVDDLFRMEGDPGSSLKGPFSFVLFPRKAGQFIGSRLALLIRRAMILYAARAESSMERIRVRPMFAQWQSELNTTDRPEAVVREIRNELETQASLLRDAEGGGRFWAGSCFVYPAENEFSDSDLNRLIGMYQEE